MKISVENFKALELIKDYEIKAVNILTGKNSIGKTSLIQLLLMIKQTFESDFDESITQLKLNRPYVQLGRFENIVTDNNLQKMIKISFELQSSELDQRYNRRRLQKYGDECSIKFDYRFKKVGRRTLIDQYCITVIGDEEHKFSLTHIEKSKYELSVNSDIFIRDNYGTKLLSLDDIKDNGIKTNVTFINLKPLGMKTSIDKSNIFISLNGEFQGYQRELEKYFRNISYIGPLRDEPHKYYFNDEEIGKSIGIKGEYAVQMLASERKDSVGVMKYIDEDNYLFSKRKIQLINAVRYWMCDVFKMSKGINTRNIDNNTMTKINFINYNGKKIPITHVGFGISQILPIIVEGLRMNEKGLLILEQPEIHLHPNVQAQLFDFIFSLSLLGKNILVETHSDHLITRMRRRVSEDFKNEIKNDINLTFVEDVNGRGEYHTININELGNLEHWPDGFCDQIDLDYRKIVRAQSNRRRAK